MLRAATPMIHVPDVRAAAAWYERLGFRIAEEYGNGKGGLSFAILVVGDTRLMLNQGGHASDARRREVDLYVDVDDVDAIYARLGGPAAIEVIEGPHDTGYGMREVIIRDLNGFWVTFGAERDATTLPRPFAANSELALHVADPAAAESFYVGTLGCEVVSRSADCIALSSGALRLYLLRDPARDHEPVVPSFDVPDRQAALQRLQAAGCTLVPIGPHAPGEHYVPDPFGVLFDVIERPATDR